MKLPVVTRRNYNMLKLRYDSLLGTFKRHRESMTKMANNNCGLADRQRRAINLLKQDTVAGMEVGTMRDELLTILESD